MLTLEAPLTDPIPGHAPLTFVEPVDTTAGKFNNISTRAMVGTGDDVMIGGFIIGEGLQQVLVEAIGPELADRGVAGALADPVLTVTAADGTVLMVNDNWEDSQGQMVIRSLGRQSKRFCWQREFGRRSHSGAGQLYRQGGRKGWNDRSCACRGVSDRLNALALPQHKRQLTFYSWAGDIPAQLYF